MKDSFEAFILIGGKSSRMGREKAFLEFKGETFINRAVNILKPFSENPVGIILNQNQKDFIEKSSVEGEYFFDVFPERGALGGIHAALKNCRSEWVIILAIDLPLVTDQTIESLRKLAVESAAEIAALVPVQPDGRFQPLCAVYRKDLCLSEVEKLLQSDSSYSVRDFLKVLNVFFIDSKDYLHDTGSLFLNVNSPIDYEKLILIESFLADASTSEQ